jgi:hypothetical protein
MFLMKNQKIDVKLICFVSACANVEICRCEGMKICKLAGRICKYADMQLCG